jgi:hypothetical protein
VTKCLASGSPPSRNGLAGPVALARRGSGSGHRPFLTETSQAVGPRRGPASQRAVADDLAGGSTSEADLDEGLARVGTAPFRRLIESEATQQHLSEIPNASGAAQASGTCWPPRTRSMRRLMTSTTCTRAARSSTARSAAGKCRDDTVDDGVRPRGSTCEPTGIHPALRLLHRCPPVRSRGGSRPPAPGDARPVSRRPDQPRHADTDGRHSVLRQHKAQQAPVTTVFICARRILG